MTPHKLQTAAARMTALRSLFRCALRVDFRQRSPGSAVILFGSTAVDGFLAPPRTCGPGQKRSGLSHRAGL